MIKLSKKFIMLLIFTKITSFAYLMYVYLHEQEVYKLDLDSLGHLTVNEDVIEIHLGAWII